MLGHGNVAAGSFANFMSSAASSVEIIPTYREGHSGSGDKPRLESLIDFLY